MGENEGSSGTTGTWWYTQNGPQTRINSRFLGFVPIVPPLPI